MDPPRPLTPYPLRIEGTRVILRDFEPDDLDATMAIAGDPEVTRSLSFDTRTREEQALHLARDIERASGPRRPDYYLAVVVRSTGLLIGFVRMGLGSHRSGELGYAIRKDHWGQGYATEAAALVLDYGFTTLGRHRVTAATGPENRASRAVLARLGFHEEGRLRHHVFTNGAWRDSILYALLEHEWRGLPRAQGRGAR